MESRGFEESDTAAAAPHWKGLSDGEVKRWKYCTDCGSVPHTALSIINIISALTYVTAFANGWEAVSIWNTQKKMQMDPPLNVESGD